MFKFFINKTRSKNQFLILGMISIAITATLLTLVLIGPATVQAQAPNIPTEPGFDLFDPVLWINWLITALGVILLQFASWLLAAAGLILETIIKWSILDIKDYISAPSLMAVWRAFRDIANMLLIFVVLYIAISTMIGNGGDMKKVLTRVVLVALLLNFSIFFTKIAIDASNITTIAFYNQIVSSHGCQESTVAQVGGIGGAFVCKLGITNLFSPEVTNAIVASSSGGFSGAAKTALHSVLGSIFIVVTAFVLLATAALLILRLVSFIFIILLSPLAFISLAIPGYDEHWEDWKTKLINNCLFAPAMMALFWATLQISNVLPQVSGLGMTIVGTPEGKILPEMGSVLLSYGVLISLILYSLTIANDFGARGAKKVSGYVKSATKGVQGYIGRNTLGRVGAGIDKKLDGQNSYIGRLANTRTGNIVRGATVGALAKSGFGSKIGYKKLVEEKEKANATYAEKVEKQVKTSSEGRIAMTTQKLSSLQAIKSEREGFKSETRKDLENKIGEYQIQVETLKKEQDSDSRLLNTTTNPAGYRAIKDRIDERSNKIATLENKISSGPEAIQLKNIKEAQEKSLGQISKDIQDTKGKIDDLKTLKTGEGDRLFKETGKEKEAQVRGAQIGLTKDDLEEFVKAERKSFTDALEKSGVKAELAREAAKFNKPVFGMLSEQKKALVKILRDGKKTKSADEEMMELVKSFAKKNKLKLEEDKEGEKSNEGNKKEGGDKK